MPAQKAILRQPGNDSPLRNPLAELVEAKEMTPDEERAAARYMFLGVDGVLQVFQEHLYDARRQAEILLEIVEKGSPSEKMKAMDRLERLRNEALVRRGMMVVNPTPVLPGTMSPLGLPQPRPIQSVEMTTKRVRMFLGDPADDEERPEHTAPPTRATLPENSNGQAQEVPDDEDAEYFRDAWDESCNIARPPSGDFGRGAGR